MLSNDHGAGNAKRRQRMESFLTDHSASYTRAQLAEACMDVSMDATEQTYANCQVVINEKNSTINALQEERDQFKEALDQQLLTYKELQDKQIALLNKHIVLRNAQKKLKTNVKAFIEIHKDSCVLLEEDLEDSDSD